MRNAGPRRSGNYEANFWDRTLGPEQALVDKFMGQSSENRRCHHPAGVTERLHSQSSTVWQARTEPL